MGYPAPHCSGWQGYRLSGDGEADGVDGADGSSPASFHSGAHIGIEFGGTQM